MPMNAPLIQNERDGLLAFLEHQREAVRNATYGLREDQVRLQPTPSALTLGGLVKHLTQGERDWSGMRAHRQETDHLSRTTWRGLPSPRINAG